MLAPSLERETDREIVPEAYDLGALIYATIEDSYIDTEAQKYQFEEIVERAVSTTVDPLTVEAITTTAGIYRWRMFGRRGEFLPPGLVKFADEDSKYIHICLDPRLFSPTAFGNCMQILEGAGLSDLLKQRTEQRQANMPTIKEAFRQSTMSSPVYQLVSAFCGEPFVESQALPLSTLERIQREKQIERDVREKFGLEGHTAIERRSMADVVMRRAIFRLDDETSHRRDQSPKPDDGIARARKYFLGIAQKYWDRVDAPRQGNGVVGWNEETRELSVVDHDGQRIGELHTEDIIQETVRHHITSYQYAHGLDHSLLSPFVRSLFWNDRNMKGTNVTKRLEIALEKTTTDDQVIFGSGSQSTERMWHLEDTGFMLLPEGDVLTASSLELLTRKYAFSSRSRYANVRDCGGVNVITRDRMLDLANSSIGTVEVDRSIFSPVGRVLILNTPKQDIALPRLHGYTGIKVRCYDDEGKLPFIPGAKLVGQESGAYCFSPADQDPYATCHVPIEHEPKMRLIEQYKQLGMHGLAQRLQDESYLTVEGLRAAIEGENEYLITDKYLSGIYNTDSMTLDQFERFILNGRAQLQCTGSHHFLRLSLESVFGRGCCGSVIGHAFSRNHTRLTEITHVQTTFTHNGLTYILDATPTSFDTLGYQSDNRSNNQAQPQVAYSLDHVDVGKISRANSLPLAKIETLGAISLQEIAEPTNAEKLGLIAKNLNDQLCIYFDMPHIEALNERLCKLPGDDPIRRALKVLLRAADSGAIADRSLLEEAVDYVEAYPRLERSTLSKYGLRQYDIKLLSILSNALARAAQLADD